MAVLFTFSAVVVLLNVLQLHAFDARRGFAPGEHQPQIPNQRAEGGGTWGVSVNKDKGRGPQIRTEGQGNIWSSKDGNWQVDGHGHHEAGKGRKPSYGGGVEVKGRWRRDIDEEINPAVSTEIREKRSPQPQSDRGSVGVSINKDQGRGPQVRTDARGNIYSSPNGKFNVDGHGHHEFGRGRKPDYGAGVQAGGNIYTSPNKNWKVDGTGNYDVGRGRKPAYGAGVSVTGRFRRDTEGAEDAAEEIELVGRQRRSPQPQRDRGSVGVSVNKDQGRGPQVRTDASGNIYSSPNGKFNVDGHGHHEFGRGRKPDYGAGVQAGGNIYTSPNKNWKVDGTGNYDVGRGRKPAYGAGVSVTGRFRRDTDAAEENELEGRLKRSTQQVSRSGDRGSWGVSVNKDKGRGPQVRTEGKGNVYSSPSGNVKVDAQGHHEFGKGRKPSYGGGVSVSGKWRRAIPDEEFSDLPDESNERVKRSASPDDNRRGSVSVGVSHDKGRGPHVRTEVERNFYRSPNRNFEINGNGYHEAGRGMKPNYGVGISATGRW